MTQQQNNIVLGWWVVVTDKREYKLSDKEFNMLLNAEQKGIRLVKFDDFMLNTAFVKEAYLKKEQKDLRFNSIKGEENMKAWVVESKSVQEEIMAACNQHRDSSSTVDEVGDIDLDAEVNSNVKD
jgi:hypothetical protein